MFRRLVPTAFFLLVASNAHAQQPPPYQPPPPPPYQPYAQPAYAPPPYAPYPPPRSGPDCPPIDGDEEEWDDVDANGCKKKRKPWERGSVFGVRVGMTTTKAAETNGTFVAATVAGQSEQFKTSGYFTVHESSHASIGGGSAGFEGGLGAMITFGVRAPFGESHGPFARIGLGGELLGNQRFYFSRLSLPIAEIGYQYIKGRTVLELGARGAPLITGRYNTGHRTKRELGGGSLEWGGYLAVHGKVGRIDVSYMRIEADDNFPGGAVNVLRGNGCVYVSRIGICADGMYLRGDAYFSLPLLTGVVTRDVRSFYGGLTIGVIDL